MGEWVLVLVVNDGWVQFVVLVTSGGFVLGWGLWW